jgi:hypothetical protein
MRHTVDSIENGIAIYEGGSSIVDVLLTIAHNL